MTDVEGPEFLGITAGGSAAGGNYVWLTLQLGDKSQTILVEKSRVGVLMSGLATAAGMAAKDRLLSNPGELFDGTDAAYALDLEGASIGRSTVDETTILDVVVSSPAGPMSVFFAGKPAAVAKLRATCDLALRTMGRKLARRRAN